MAATPIKIPPRLPVPVRPLSTVKPVTLPPRAEPVTFEPGVILANVSQEVKSVTETIEAHPGEIVLRGDPESLLTAKYVQSQAKPAAPRSIPSGAKPVTIPRPIPVPPLTGARSIPIPLRSKPASIPKPIPIPPMTGIRPASATALPSNSATAPKPVTPPPKPTSPRSPKPVTPPPKPTTPQTLVPRPVWPYAGPAAAGVSALHFTDQKKTVNPVAQDLAQQAP